MEHRVICVCGGYGFPISASAARIIMVGKALQESGIGLQVLHCGPSPIAINRQKVGVYEGIPFQYTTCVRRPENRLARLLVYLWALVGLTLRLAQCWPARRSTLVYLYVQDGALNLYAGALCQLLKLAVVQEFCEWLPGQLNPSPAFNAWLYRKRIFKAATGALVISKAIEERVRERCAEACPHLLVRRVGVMVDAHRFATASAVTHSSNTPVPNFVWCGTWLNDVFFLIRAFALVKLQGYECKLTIIGVCGEESGPALLDYAQQHGLSARDLVLAGCVDERTLAGCYKAATGLLMPLWNDDKSITRLPNKMGEYLASGRPVVTCNVGDLTDFLLDDINARLAEPGSERGFADSMINLLQDPNRATEMGAAGQQICFAQLDYRAHASGLATFFLQCIEHHNRERLDSNTSPKHRGSGSRVAKMTEQYGADHESN
jgi:glycosyltransferase involved in cell wall biosynthesis